MLLSQPVLKAAREAATDQLLPPAQDATANISEAVQERVTKHLRKAPIIDATITKRKPESLGVKEVR